MSGGGGGGSSNPPPRVPIPDNVRNTIDDIREITGKQHTDDEIYAVLRECSMDPNETAQKLLYLDTFHEVKSRRDRKKEGLSSRAYDDSRSKQGGQGRGGRSASGGYSSNFHDGGGGRRSPAIRRENGVNHIAERSHAPSTQPVLQKTKTSTTSQATRVSAVAPQGAANQSNEKSAHGFAGQSLIGSVTNLPKSSSAASYSDNEENVQSQAAAVAAASAPKTFSSVTSTDQRKSLSSSDQLQTHVSVSGAYPSSLDPVLAPSISRNVSSAISREVGSNRITAGPNLVKGNKIVLHEVDDLPASKNEKSGSMILTSKKNAPQKLNEVENNRLSEPSQLSSSSSLNGSSRPSSSRSSQPPPGNATEISTTEASVQSSTELRQHVTFPNHFQVPKALKSGLTFGSFGASGLNERSSSETGSNNNASALESSLGNDESATSSNQSAPLTAQGDHLDYPHSSSYLIEKTPVSESNSITHSDSNGDQPKPEALLAPKGQPIQTVQRAQNYGMNFMSTMLGTQQVQFEGTEAQVQETSHFPNFVGAGSQAVSSPSQTPPLQSSIPVSPQSVSIFRPPYPANFFPYGHYYPPFYVSPMHQFLGHNGFPQQPSAGNMYLPAAAAAAAAGIKFPVPQFKAGANSGNAAHIGIPSGSFITPPVGYTASPTLNTGSSSGNEDLTVSQLKENQIYTTGQLSEGSAVWIPAPSQDVSSMQVNSLYNLTPQGQHLTFPPTQAGHGAFSGIYPPGPAVASPSTLLQQSQAVAGPVENVGRPSGSYQQPQPAQINWNAKF
ncbi:hypothetical protein RIF29_18133 [Crotalaria pallida]|uniref:GBF-interacting protein 1 N-terminal domain-containing protein n=1 Tax=Crotalaria pallida TaxID=3830 RepID=A0AAN9IFY4_CROPI